MVNDLENRIKLLEKELQEKDQLIATLQRFYHAWSIMSTNIHDAKNNISILSVKLSSHFEVCRKLGFFDKHINDIIEIVEEIRNSYKIASDYIWAGISKDTISIGESLKDSVGIMHKQLQESRILVEIEIGSDTSHKKVLKSDFNNLIRSILLNSIDALQRKNGNRKIQIKTNSDGKSTTLTIQDNGCGISDEIISKIWTPFFTTKKNKAGLGLFMAKKIVELLGGQIEIKSELSMFTQVTIILPDEKETIK